MIIGYARVSTVEQNLELQLSALKEAGCVRIYTDKASGRNHKNPGLKRAIRALKAGDTLVAWSLDRLGRTMKGLIDLQNLLDTKRIHLKFLVEHIDTRTSTGRFLYNIKAAFSVMELERNRERTMAGLAAARAAGRVGGRKKVMTNKKVFAAKQMLAEGMSREEVAGLFGVSVSTIYREIPAKSKAVRLTK